MKAVLEMVVRSGVDLVLIQEPRGESEKDGTCSHPSFTFIRGDESMAAKCWITINQVSRCWVTELKELIRECGNHTQVVEVVPPGGEAIVIANIYDQDEASEAIRPAEYAAWGEIASHRRVIIAGDMNAQSKMWNPRSTSNRNHTFCDQHIENEDLFV
jgi:hypothetical protein